MDSILTIPFITSASISGFSFINNDMPNVLLDVALEEYVLKTNSKIQLLQSFVLTNVNNKIQSICNTPINIDQTVIKKSFSPSRRFICSFFEAKDNRKLSIIDTINNVKILDFDLTKVHGKFYFDNPFSNSPSWSFDENKLLYIAEELLPSFNKDGIDSKMSPKDAYIFFSYREDFGERFSNRGRPLLFLLDVGKQSVSNITPMSKPSVYYNVLEAIWIRRHDKSFILTNLLAPTPIILGQRFCNNRDTLLSLLDIEPSQSTIISQFVLKGTNYSSLISNDDEFVCLKSAYSNAHYNPEYFVRGTISEHGEFFLCPLSSFIDSPDICLDNLYHAKSLFNYTLDGLIFVSCQTGFKIVSFILNLHTNSIILVAPSLSGSFTLTDAIISPSSVIMVGKSTSFVDPPRIFMSTSIKPSFASFKWNLVSASYYSTANFDLKLMDLSKEFKDCYPEYCDQNIILEVLFITNPHSMNKSPLIVFAHGGPHVAYINQWSRTYSFFLEKGYKLLFVNYTGSSSYDPKSLYTLVGQIGELDVHQVIFSTEYLISQHESFIDATKVYYMGGSHGGYIGAWLSSNHVASCDENCDDMTMENLFTAFVLLNPVTDLVLSLFSSDIPEWALCESGIEFNNEFSLLTNKKSSSFKELWKRSPIRVGHLANRPILVIVGDKDRRVHPLNGIRFAQTTPICKLVSYPENGHALDSVIAEYSNAKLIHAFFSDPKGFCN